MTCIYVVTNPAWEGWAKVGTASGRVGEAPAKSRMSSFNVCSPFQDFILHHTFQHANASTIESLVHAMLGSQYEHGKGEWFKATPEQAWAVVMAAARSRGLG
jgi:hypothetical protein